jgi:hypothetical protein
VTGLQFHEKKEDLPESQIWVLLCKESATLPCPVAKFPSVRTQTGQHDLRVFLDNLALPPVALYPDPEHHGALEHHVGFANPFLRQTINEVRITYDSNESNAVKTLGFLQDTAKGLSLQYRGQVQDFCCLEVLKFPTGQSP